MAIKISDKTKQALNAILPPPPLVKAVVVKMEPLFKVVPKAPVVEPVMTALLLLWAEPERVLWIRNRERGHRHRVLSFTKVGEMMTLQTEGSDKVFEMRFLHMLETQYTVEWGEAKPLDLAAIGF